jgi:hypothetical protein
MGSLSRNAPACNPLEHLFRAAAESSDSALRTAQFCSAHQSELRAANMTRRRRCDRRSPQKLQLGFPAGSSVRNTPPTEVIATVTSLAGLTGS